MLKVGDRVGNYRVVSEIGDGAMGVVFHAVHETIERHAAIKVLRRELSLDPQFVNRFLDEARAVNLVRHPGLVEIFEHGLLPDGNSYLVMEFLEGESLADRLDRTRGRLWREEALDLIRPASALLAAHQKGIVHRDLKPDNMMLIPDVERPEKDRIKILDFGIAKMTGSSGGHGEVPLRTRTGMVMGTAEYMAPEQCLGASKVDGKADVYSLGIIFYEVLCGQRPFAADSVLELMSMQVREAPVPVSQRAPDIDEGTAALVGEMLAKNPAQRPDMAQVLERVLLLSGGTGPSPWADLTPAPPVAATGGQGRRSPNQRPFADPTLLPGQPPNPFVSGPPITSPRCFFGRERELRRLFGLWQQVPLQNAAIIGPRRSGKTSLLYYLKNITSAAHLRPGQRSTFLPSPERYRFVFVDFQDPRLGKRDGLLRHVLLSLNLPAPPRCTLDESLGLLAERLTTPTVILFDEIDVALDRYPELDDAFWDALRALATNQVDGNLAFVLASHEAPYDLARTSQRGSPFFNIFGYSATLGPLTEPEARDLIASSPIRFSDSSVDWILEQSGRWPMLVQILCRECLNALEEDNGDDWQEEGVRQMLPFRHLLKG
jgi:serine/threonine protein kinase